jgi:pimeloyl-ACP methyl ester carboxylesterase
MTRFLHRLRQARRQLRYLAGYVELPGERAGAVVPRLADFARCQRPVLLLYGFFSTRRTFEVLERRLRRDGYCVFSVDLGGLRRTFNTRGIDDLADYVRAKVERIYGRNPGLGPLTIIGHSKGGLIGAYYVKKLGGWRRTRALVTLGTPHHGTPAAYAALPLGIFAHSLWQMTPMSPFLRRLWRGAWPPGVRFTSIYSRDDKVAPFPTALVETHGLAYIRNVEVAARGHREFLYKKRVYDALLEELRAGEAPAPVHLGKLRLIAETRAARAGGRAG